MRPIRQPTRGAPSAWWVQAFTPCWIVLACVLGFSRALECRGADPPAASPANATSPASPSISFELDVQPILTAHGCNAGACHGKQRGQNGFQLSLLGFDPQFDYDALVRQGRGRRIFPAAPRHSLLLQKPTGQLPHGGGILFEVDSPDYQVLHQWLTEGVPRAIANEPHLVGIEVNAREATLEPHGTLQLSVTASYSDGSHRDVTDRTTFQSQETAISKVDKTGRVTAGPLPGETAIMSRYMGQIDVTQILIPLKQPVPEDVYRNLPRQNWIDDLVWEKLAALRILPSSATDDASFLRRASLDIIGQLPRPEEVRRFVADSTPNKREALIDQLLERPEYADHWATKWADLLRPNPYRVGIKAVLNYDHWIRDQFRKNRPYDQWVRDLVTAQGSTWHNGASTLFRDRRSADEIATLVSQLFLGIRLECAKCHHHPFEKWSQHDFYSFAAYFARVGRKGTGLSPPISGGEEIVFVASKGTVTHPVTGESLEPKPLADAPPSLAPEQDPRVALADWMTQGDHLHLARVQVNRIWKEMMGRGIVEPVDDLRATNPPSNARLLDALARYFRDQGYDQKQLIRLIATSYVYGLDSLPNERNAADRVNFSRHYRKRLSAEVLHDAICQITGIESNFSAMPPRAAANQIWTHRVSSLFLDTFGRPDPNQDPPCERTPESTVTQTLHLMNAPEIHRKLTHQDGRIAQLAASTQSNDQAIEQIYLLIYGRLPDSHERGIAHALLTRGEDRKLACEDLAWALVNTPEFFLND